MTIRAIFNNGLKTEQIYLAVLNLILIFKENINTRAGLPVLCRILVNTFKTFSNCRKAGRNVPMSKYQHIEEDKLALLWLNSWLIKYWGLRFMGGGRRDRKGDLVIERYDKPFNNKV
jgi:hypothetical protein